MKRKASPGLLSWAYGLAHSRQDHRTGGRKFTVRVRAPPIGHGAVIHRIVSSPKLAVTVPIPRTFAKARVPLTMLAFSTNREPGICPLPPEPVIWSVTLPFALA